MKIKSFLTCCLMLLVIGFSAFAQDKEMGPEAGKLFNEGNKLLKAGNYNGAISQYDQALNIEKDYRIYYQKGIAHKKAGEFPKAKEALEASIKLKPDFEGSYNALGGVYFSLSDYELAVSNFEKVLSTTKNNSTKSTVKKNLSFAYAKMGNEALTNGNSTKAAEYLRKAVEFNNYDAAYLSLAKLYTETGEFDKAISASENALKYRSSISKGGPYYYMGLAYKGKKELNKAKQMFTEARSDVTYKKTAEYELQLLQ
jgi:tetratricopeptide (TPR) repeat protein